MTRCALIVTAALLGACSTERTVRLDLGLDGFVCTSEDGRPLYLDALQGDMLTGQLVVDVITLGGNFPGCLGEDILDRCDPASCFTAARACRTFSFPIGADPQVGASFLAALSGWAPIADAPDGPVIVRVVATTEPCAAIDQPLDGRFAPLDSQAAIGCAYSCPTVLDEVERVTVGVGFVVGEQCEQLVRGCAGAL